MKARRLLGLFVVTVLGALVAVIVYARLFQPGATVVEVPAENQFHYVNLPGISEGSALDFTGAVEQSINAVVNVKTKEYREYQVNPLYEFFFGEQPDREAPPRVGSGSGVIIAKQGYIVTNYHVIEDSDEVAVVLNNKREYDAKVIGTDPNTDLALIKIEADGLSPLTFGDSDALQLGEWVLAIGNPYYILTSTVTAGIVSAKARNLPFLRTREFSIESFIQTDAAVNPGNSGGALINTRGELVGINTAIASRSGAFEGYSFAIPVSIVEKVVRDLMEYGEVQRAILGVEIRDVTDELAREENIDELEGVFVTGVRENGAARQAGIREKDIIISIDDTRVNSSAELQELVSKYRPGQEVRVVIKRDGRLKQFNLVLRNLEGSTEIVKKDRLQELLGASFEPRTAGEEQILGI